MKDDITLRKALAEQEKLKGQLSEIRNSFSFRLGNMLVQAVYSPGRNTVLLPYRLIRLFVRGFRKRRASIIKVGKYTGVSLSDVKLNACTTEVKERYMERFGEGNSRHGWFREDLWRRIEYVSSLLPEAKIILDIGIHSGAFLNLLIATNRFQRILGIDIIQHPNFTMLSDSKLYEIMYASVAELPFADKSIDIITCMEVLEHLDGESFLAALRELRRVVNHLLIITVPYNEPEPLYRGHKRKFTDSDLSAYFPSGEFILLKKSTRPDWMVIVERT